MALFNYASKEITLKVVYYGPGLSGKTTNLQHLHVHLEQARQSKLLSLATETDRTLFFDFLPMDLGSIGGFKVKFQLYTVPGQVRYDATRKLVLKGADAVVFVADSQRAMRDSNLVSYENMKDNLAANNLDPKTILLVLQYNKRDLPDGMSVEEMNQDLNERKVPFFEASAVEGTGVYETFEEITRMLVQEAGRRQKMLEQGRTGTRAIPARPPAARAGGPARPEAPKSADTAFQSGSEAFFDANSFGGGGSATGAGRDPSRARPTVAEGGHSSEKQGVPSQKSAGGEGQDIMGQLVGLLARAEQRDAEILGVLKEIRDYLRSPGR